MFSFLKEFFLLILNKFVNSQLGKIIINSKIFILISSYEYITLGITGCIIENSVLLVSSGAYCKTIEKAGFLILICSIVSFIFDFLVFVFIKFFVSKFTNKNQVNNKNNIFIKILNVFLKIFSYLLGFLSLIIEGVILFVLKIIFFIVKLFKKDFDFSINLSALLKKTGKYSMIFYRFVPFIRIPTMIMCTQYDFKEMVLFNILGSFLANSFFILNGFWLFN